LIEPRARELLRSFGGIIVICCVFGTVAGIALVLPIGEPWTYGALRGLTTGLIAATTIGGLETLFDRGSLMWFVRRIPLPVFLLGRIFFYMTCMVLSVLLGRLLARYAMDVDGAGFAIDGDFWAAFYVTGCFSFLLIAAYKIAPLVGMRTLWNVLIGAYMRPKQEERAIVFMDLIGSTRLTERIGDAGFMRFLNDSIFRLTRPIVRNRGGIYRYVGDEIILSWPAKEATRAAQCVFDMEAALREHRPYFERRFGTYPRFRYGIHLGNIMVGELGDLRVEIAMLGDAINTTKRIEDACRQFDFNIMASSQFIQHATLPHHIHAVPVEEIAVRGKSEKLRLFGLVHATHRLVSNPMIRLEDYERGRRHDTLDIAAPPLDHTGF